VEEETWGVMKIRRKDNHSSVIDEIKPVMMSGETFCDLNGWLGRWNVFFPSTEWELAPESEWEDVTEACVVPSYTNGPSNTLQLKAGSYEATDNVHLETTPDLWPYSTHLVYPTPRGYAEKPSYLSANPLSLSQWFPRPPAIGDDAPVKNAKILVRRCS